MTEPRMEHRDAFWLAGCPQYSDPKARCPGEAWGRLKHLCATQDPPLNYSVEYAVQRYPDTFPTEPEFYYLAGFPAEPSKHLDLPPGVFFHYVPAAEYAVFNVPEDDPANVANALYHAYHIWLPGSKYKVADNFDLEEYAWSPSTKIRLLVPVAEKGSGE